jgi:hypothetical protein
VSLHPFREPLGAAFIVAKGAIGGISDPSNVILSHVTEFRDFFSCEEEPGVITRDLEKLFLIELHGVLLSLVKGLVVVGKHASVGQDGFAPVDFGGIRQQHELTGGQQ